MQRLSAEGAGWVPTAGNLATLFAFGLCLALIPQLAQDFDEAIFVLAPILLLLNQARLPAVSCMLIDVCALLLCSQHKQGRANKRHCKKYLRKKIGS